MINRGNNLVRPYIAVSAAGNAAFLDTVKEILAGIEEEGIPSKLEYVASPDTVSLAYISARQSPLEVGIAVGQRGDVAVHYRRLPEEKPLFYLSPKEGNRDAWRRMGSHGARLVKGICFKDNR